MEAGSTTSQAAGAPSDPCFGAASRDLSGDSTIPIGQRWYCACFIESQFSYIGLYSPRERKQQPSSEYIAHLGQPGRAMKCQVVAAPVALLAKAPHSAGSIGSDLQTGTIAQTPLGRVGQPGDISSDY